MMNKKRLITVISVISLSALASVSPTADSADKTHTVTVHDFNGEIIETISVSHGDPVDLSEIDTPAMNDHLDEYTQIGFNQWSDYPDSITDDIDIYALYVKMTIAGSAAKKTEYYSNSGKIDTSGIKITITKFTQLPQTDKNGNFKVEKEVTDLTEACEISPENLEEAFASGNTSKVKIIPPKSNRAFTYNISFFSDLGDINLDKLVDAEDASEVLSIYSELSTGIDPKLTESEKLRCDIDRDNVIDASDASTILSYYAVLSTTNREMTWDEFLA